MIIFTVATKAKKVFFFYGKQHYSLLAHGLEMHPPYLPRWRKTVDTHGIDEKEKYQWNFGN
jgi:hypothetical protein